MIWALALLPLLWFWLLAWALCAAAAKDAPGPPGRDEGDENQERTKRWD